MSEIAARRELRSRALTARRVALPSVPLLLAWLIVAANAAVIVVLWDRGGNVAATSDLGQWLTSLGRLTGLLAEYLALVQLLLLARLPFVERAIGFDRLTVQHRFNGRLVIALVCAHVLFTTLGYALVDRISIRAEIAVLLSSYPGMVAAVVGTALFVVVAASSVVIVRRRLRYEIWYAVHICVYLAIALAWVHQIPTGNEFITNPLAAMYWTMLYAGTLATMAFFRVARPLLDASRYRLRVERVESEGPAVMSIYLGGRDLHRLGAAAGQFFLWRFFTWNRFWESHPFSLSAAPDGRSLRITVKGVGDFTRHVKEIPPGTRVMAEGPFGTFTASAQRRDRVLLIAGGIGITPIRALLEELTGNLVLLYRVLSEDDIVFRSELDDLARRRGIRVHYLTGDHRDPATRDFLSPAHLRSLVPDIAERDAYVCGPPPMMDAVQRSLRAAGVPPSYIHSERFAL